MQINPRLPDELLDGGYQRTEQRGVNLLLRAIPADQQQALISARELNSTALLFRLMVRYQPGGSGEKAILLSKLTALDKSSTVTELAAALRSWRRHFARAGEIDAVLPDGTLLLAALEPACTMIATQDSQASFRLAQSRLQLGIDQRPHHQGVWRFSQCLLAEAETLSLMINAPIASPQPSIKVKQMEAPVKPSAVSNGQIEKGKGVSTAAQPCRYFRSDTGRKAGKNCKWSHSWDGVEDKNARCWICGGKDHRKSDCKLKSQQSKGSNKDHKSSGEPGAGSGGGKGQTAHNVNAGAPKSTTGAGAPSPATTYATPKLQEMDAGEQASAVPQSEPGGGAAAKQGGGGETGATSSEVLLQEATKLLKSLRAPQLRVIKVSQLDYDNSSMMVLLDSGATHALRPATSEEEWESANPTQVSLADGTTNKLRLKPEFKGAPLVTTGG